MSAAERSIERARIVALQDINGPRECWTLLVDLEHNLIEQDGAESMIEELEFWLGIGTDPSDPTMRKFKSTLDTEQRKLDRLQVEYQTLEAAYASYDQCR